MNRLVVALKFRLRGLKPRLVEMILAPVVTGKNSKNAVDASNELSSRQVYYSPFWFFASDKFFSKSAPNHIFPSTSFCSAAFNLST